MRKATKSGIHYGVLYSIPKHRIEITGITKIQKKKKRDAEISIFIHSAYSHTFPTIKFHFKLKPRIIF